MDETVKILTEKVSQLISLFNSMGNNSKKIHELEDIESNGPLWIATTDGVNTGKKEYKQSDVTSEQFENIAQMKLKLDSATSSLQIQDKQGDVISSVDVSPLNGNNVELTIDDVNENLQLLNYEGEIISNIPLNRFVAQHKQKQIFTHKLLEEDLTDEMRINLQLESVPDQDEWFDLHINGGFVSDNSYHIDNDLLVIHRDDIKYPITVDKVITFRYRAK